MEIKRSEQAKETFASGFNCAQSVLSTYGKEYFKNEADALRMASGFGAGMSYRGEVCGAVTAALMVLGLKHGFDKLEDKDAFIEKSRLLIEKFEEENGSILCRKLLNVDVNTPEGLAEARENGLFRKTCPRYIESASLLLESFILKDV
jgi:C_GCAxxG_C_C family probable redox protein